MAEATDTAVREPMDPLPASKAPRAPARPQPNPLMLLFQGLASLRLTVVLLLLGSLLVFFGTLAQVDGGIWQIVSKYFRSYVVWIPFQIFNVFAAERSDVAGGFPFPGGWTIGFFLLVNLFSAHALRFRFRVGILLTHAGLVVLLLSEFVTGMWAIETKMNINEGSFTNYAYDTREAELAIVDASDPDNNHVVAIPQSLLAPGSVIQHEQLPFDIRVDEFYENSSLVRRQAGKEALATFGTGLTHDAKERSVITGTDPNQSVDIPAAYFTLRRKGSDTKLGTCMTSCQLDVPFREDWDTIGQKRIVDGKPYQLNLRYRRYYKPYDLHLIDFRFDRYQGTQIPKNYSSDVRLVNPSSNEDREIHIKMNHPLRYQGETFFQSSFTPNERGTILQVVNNPGWLMPYISCTMISLGLIIHFSQTLFKFLQRELAK